MAKPKLNLASFTGVVAAASGTTTAPDAEIQLSLIDVERQVRTKLGDLADLVASIHEVGVLEPIIVLAKLDGRFRLIAGERRVRASIEAGKVTVPALIKRGLSDLQIRQIQVTENNERESLSAYDEAMGVAEDVEKFGFKEAMRIWNRSEAWVSKRLAVTKYADPVREVLRTELCGDLEVLHSLNQLHALSIDEYQALVDRLRSGVPLGRDDARNKVSAVKVWKKQTEEAAKAIQASAPPVDPDAAAIEAPAVPPNGASEERPTGPAAGGKKSVAKKPMVAAKPGKGDQGQRSNPAQDPDQAAEAERERVTNALSVQRAELMEWGDVLRPHFNTMQTHMATLGYPLAEGEWVLWTGFLDTVLPMLASLGTDRGLAYLRRLQSELKTKDPITWWRDLHPAGNDKDGDDASREPLAEMPKGWTF